METSVVESIALSGSVAGDGLSIWSLLINADLIIKGVILILVVASFWCWTIIFDKTIRFRRLRGLADRFEEAFWSGGSLEDLYDRVGTRPDHPMASIFVAAMAEWRRSTAGNRGLDGSTGGQGLTVGLHQRIGQAMQVALNREVEKLERYMDFLATVGSTAPFIGLFGTVWGIMNSFQSIAASKNASLAVVAPGIAEALFATALGLVAAIPAVIAYNKLSGDLNRYEGRLDAFSVEFSAILSRQLEEDET